MISKFGLIGTITYDSITHESGMPYSGLGGVLYQAAVLCGLGREVILFTNLGEGLTPAVGKIIRCWPTLRRYGINRVSGPGNQVLLHYPEEGERVEVLKSVVPPLNPSQVMNNLSELTILVCVINSGFDIELGDWQKIVSSSSCPVWLDIHSLCLSRTLNKKREYVPLNEWKAWVEGVSFVQANGKEIASILGHPDELLPDTKMLHFGKMAFELGVKAVCVTLGNKGVLLITPEEARTIASSEAEHLVDTTGCGDVLCGATVAKLAEGEDIFSSVSFGVELAAKAVGIAGIGETYALASGFR